MGQVQCVPADPDGNAPYAAAIPYGRWKESLLSRDGSVRGTEHAICCIVTQLAPISGVVMYDSPAVSSRRVGRLRPGSVLIAHEESADRAWVRITRRAGRLGELPWPDADGR